MGSGPSGQIEKPERDPVISARIGESNAILDVITRYFDQFARDPAAAALFYGEPATMYLADRSVIFDDRTHIESFLGKSLAALKRHGYSHSRIERPRTKLLNATTALHGVVAVRMRADGTAIESLGVTYIMRKNDKRWLIYGWIATDADKLISPG